jgi:hypothetical protein
LDFPGGRARIARLETKDLLNVREDRANHAAAGTSQRYFRRSVAGNDPDRAACRLRRVWAQLIDHLIAGERDADQDELHGLIAYCHERLALLNGPHADFIFSMQGTVKRFAATPRQRRWALNIVHRLLLLERESTKDRGLGFTR